MPIHRATAELFGVRYETYRLVGFPELAGGIGLIVGIWWQPLAVAAASGVVLLMLGALVLRIRAHDEPPAMIVDGVFLLLAAITLVLQVTAG
jgi:hypothetical protein